MSSVAPNSPEALTARVASGQLRWTGPIIVSLARTPLSFLAQGATALVLEAQGVPDPYVEAGKWFTVHGTLVDLGSLAVIAWFLRREGLSLTDLFRSGREPRLWKSLLWVPLLLLVLGAAGFVGAALTGLIVSGTPLIPPPTSHLPLWAGLYGTIIWPLVWGFTEQATYDGYAAPRVRALSSSRWALAIVCIGWAAQHLALPFRPDPVFWAYRFFPALAVAVTSVALYLRTRNLLPFALAHWLVDAGTGALTLLPPPQ